MGKLIFLILLPILAISQTVTVRHYSSHSEYLCSGNDNNRIVIFLDTTSTKLINIKCPNYDNIGFKISNFKFEIIYETILENAPNFIVKIKSKTPNLIKYTYKLDPLWPHRTLLVLYDCSSLSLPCRYQ